MADLKISELALEASLTGTESVEIVTGGINKKTTTGDIAALAGAIPNDSVTNAMLATDVKPLGIQDIPVPAAAMWARSSNGCSQLTPVAMATSLITLQVLNFDQTTQEFAEFSIVLPRKWDNGTIVATVYWTAIAGSGTVQWGISGGAYSNDDALTVALGSVVTVDDTLTATNDLHITSATSAITLAGTPQGGDMVQIRIQRNPASDTLNADAGLVYVVFKVTVNAAKDE